MADFSSLRESVADLQEVIQPEDPIPASTPSGEKILDLTVGATDTNENAKIFHVITADQYHGRSTKVESYVLPEGMTEEFLEKVSLLIKASKSNTLEYIQYYRGEYSSFAEFLTGEDVHDDEEMIEFGRMIFSVAS